MNIQSCCSSCVIFRNNSYQCTKISGKVDFRPLFRFTDVVFRWFLYTDIILETAAVDVTHNEADFVTMLQLNAQQRYIPLQNRTSLTFPRSFTWTVTQQNHWCTDTSITECKQVVNWRTYNVANTNSIPQFLKCFHYLVYNAW
jgi:hypothetical protein